MDISAEIAAIQAASQGSELRQPLVGALNKLNSGSLPAVTTSDVGKILKVGANGWEVGEKSGYMPVPTATKQITENGTHDVTNYASAVVNVSGGSGAGSEFQAYHVYSKGISGSDAAMYVQKGSYDLFDSTSPFTPTEEPVAVGFSGSTYNETEFDSFFILASYVDNTYNWGVIADDTVYSNGVVYVQGERVRTWYYSTSVDFYLLVNVYSGGSVLIPKTITQNGTYDPANDNADGYSEVTVNVSGGNSQSGNPFVYYKDYIRATGTQYIDTGYKLPADQTNVIIMMVCKYNMSGAADAVLFGVERCLLAYKGNNGQNYYVYTWKATGQAGTIYQASSNGRNAKAVIICDKDGYSVFASPLNRVLVQTGNNFSNAETQENIYVFASNESNSPRPSSMGQFDLYNFKVITDDGVALDLVPAKDNNNIVCMKDNVSGNYIYNAGTGDFVWGTDQ